MREIITSPAGPGTLTVADLGNLITACKTSAMRKGSPEWQAGLDLLAVKLAAWRDQIDEEA